MYFPLPSRKILAPSPGAPYQNDHAAPLSGDHSVTIRFINPEWDDHHKNGLSKARLYGFQQFFLCRKDANPILQPF